MSGRYDHGDLRRIYDGFARGYRYAGWFNDHLLRTRGLRRGVMAKASGRVLDVACGTGENFRYFSDADAVIAIDLSPKMAEQARRRAGRLGMEVDVRVMAAEELDFGDGTFDAVTSALSTCTFPDPVGALREMGRVARAGGRVLLFEHGRSSAGWMARFQERRADKHYRSAGCRWTQEPDLLVAEAGLRVVEQRRTFFGVFRAIEADPGG